MRARSRAALALAGVVSASLAGSGRADAFCRTTTCPLPPAWSPTASCQPTSPFLDSSGVTWPDFATYCAALMPPAKVLPLWWRNACISYDVQQDPKTGITTRWASYDQVVQIADAAFAQWTGATCAGGPVSIQVKNLGPVSCDQVQYNSDQANQHVILFHDDVWPYDTPGTPDSAVSTNTLGLTTVTFDSESGEIFDADTEINGTRPLSTSSAADPTAYDLASIITHEMGHFLGLAHSGDRAATMYALYTQGSTMMRTLTADDVAGICTVYPAGGTRAVDTSVSASGVITADSCDATPRHGFSPFCAQPLRRSCAVAGVGAPGAAGGGVALAAWASIGVARRRGRRPRSREASTTP
ncbi:MAG TPA: matrixin family metalloprotease [Polyangiaceae bacterium]|nr:matrixin family metalloprotease [Polyangiaceae bacterium]